MNEVTNMQMVNRLGSNPVASAASSKGAAKQPVQDAVQSNVNSTSQATGNKLPAIAEKVVGKSTAPASSERQNIEAAVASINDFVQSVQRDLQFSIDDELDRTVIKVIDSDTGNVIRQIPEEVFLDLARKLKDDGQLQLVHALG